MSTLILDPGEKAIISGASIQNAGTGPAVLSVPDDVPAIREKEFITLEQASTPALKLFYVVMLIAAEPANFDKLFPDIKILSQEIVEAAPSSKEILFQIGMSLISRQWRYALDKCYELLAWEKKVFETVQK